VTFELYTAVYSYLAYRVGEGEAERLLPDVVERARPGSAAGGPDPLLWLIEIARNVVYDALLRPHDANTVPNEGSPALARALEALTDLDRDVLGLRYGAGLTTREIARLLDWRSGAVEVALDGARARLAAELDEPADGIEALLLEERRELGDGQRAHLRDLLAAQPGVDAVRTTRALGLLAAALITVVALGAAVRNDAVGSGAHAIGSALDVVTSGVPRTSGSGNPGHAQAVVSVCHFTGSKPQPYAESEHTPQEAGAMMTQRSRDLVPAPPGGCPARLP
jgi:DNA-directed RNA polymerase specialized sigma24 family protein